MPTISATVPLADLSGPRSRRELKKRAWSDIAATLTAALVSIFCLFFLVLAILQSVQDEPDASLLVGFQAMHVLIFVFLLVSGIILLVKILTKIFKSSDPNSRRPDFSASVTGALLIITGSFDIIGNALQLFYPIAGVSKLSFAEDGWTIVETVIIASVLALLELAPSTAKQFRRWKLIFLCPVVGVSFSFWLMNLSDVDSWKDTTQDGPLALLSKTLATAFRAGSCLIGLDHLIKTIIDLLLDPLAHVPAPKLDGALQPGQFRKVRESSRNKRGTTAVRRRPRALSEGSDAGSVSSTEMTAPSRGVSSTGKEWAGAMAAIANDGALMEIEHGGRQMSVDTNVAMPVHVASAPPVTSSAGVGGGVAETVAVDPLAMAAKTIESLNANIAARGALFGRRTFASVQSTALGTVATVILLAALLSNPLPPALQYTAFTMILILALAVLGSLAAMVALSMRRGWMVPLPVPYEIWSRDAPLASGFLRSFLPSIGAAGWHLVFILTTKNVFQAVVGAVSLLVAVVQGAVSAYLLANSPLSITIHDVDAGFGTVPTHYGSSNVNSHSGHFSARSTSAIPPLPSGTSRIPVSSIMTVTSSGSVEGGSDASKTGSSSGGKTLGAAGVPLLSADTLLTPSSGSNGSGPAALSSAQARFLATADRIADLPAVSQPTIAQWARQERIELILQLFMAINVVFNLCQLLLVLWPTDQAMWTSDSLVSSIYSACKSLGCYCYSFFLGTAFAGRSSFQILLPAEAEARNASLRILYTKELPHGLEILQILAAQLELHKVGGWRWKDKLRAADAGAGEPPAAPPVNVEQVVENLADTTRKLILKAVTQPFPSPAVSTSSGMVASPPPARPGSSSSSSVASASVARAQSLSVILLNNNSSPPPSSGTATATTSAQHSSARLTPYSPPGIVGSSLASSYGSTGQTRQPSTSGQLAPALQSAAQAPAPMEFDARELSRTTPTLSQSDDPFLLIGGRDSFASVAPSSGHGAAATMVIGTRTESIADPLHRYHQLNGTGDAGGLGLMGERGPASGERISNVDALSDVEL